MQQFATKSFTLLKKIDISFWHAQYARKNNVIDSYKMITERVKKGLLW
jgi:hypothetical protein